MDNSNLSALLITTHMEEYLSPFLCLAVCTCGVCVRVYICVRVMCVCLRMYVCEQSVSHTHLFDLRFVNKSLIELEV